MVNKNITAIPIYEKDKKNFGWWILPDTGDLDLFLLLIYVSDKTTQSLKPLHLYQVYNLLENVILEQQCNNSQLERR